jgi:hypothetical protein
MLKTEKLNSKLSSKPIVKISAMAKPFFAQLGFKYQSFL